VQKAEKRIERSTYRVAVIKLSIASLA